MSRWFFKTKEEKARDAARRRERAIDKECERECGYYKRLIPDVLANSGIDHMLSRADRPTLIEGAITGAVSRQKVKIIETRYSHFAIYLWIETRKLPYRTVPADLYKPEILEALSEACERQVVWRSKPGHGSWFVVWRDGAINAIPEKFYYNDAIASIPENAGPLSFIVGVSENNALLKGDMVQMPHYLVAGSTNTGKSVHLNQMLCQLISRNTPESLQMLMIDLKGGNEFKFYENLPHLWQPIITRPEQVLEALEAYYAEMERRSDLFTSHGVKTIEGYNDKFKDAKLPYILLVFDEIALLITDRDRKMVGRAEDLLSAILARARSSGGHCVLCTQNARTDIVKPFIKINCAARICFSVPGNHDSIAILDRGDAAGLEPVGRAIYSFGPRLTEIQSPFISDDQISQIVREAIERGGALPPKRTDSVTLDDLLEEAINNYGGKLHTNLLYKAFGGRIARERIEAMVSNLVGQTITFGGRQYQGVYKGKGRHGGRMLVPLNEYPGDSATFGNQPALRLVLPRLVPESKLSLLKPKSKPDTSEDPHREVSDEVA